MTNVTRVAGQTVTHVNPLADSEWDAKLAAIPGATFFQGTAWARVLHDTYGFRPIYLTLGDSERPHPLLPLMEVDSWLTGRRGISLPFTDESASLCTAGESHHRLFQAAIAHATARGWKYLEIRGGRSLFTNSVPSTAFWGHQLDLRPGEHKLFSQLDGSVRRAVRKAEQWGVTVEFSHDSESLRIFYGLHCTTRKRHGVPPQPWRFFANIHQHILATGRGFVALARHRGVPVAGAVFFFTGQTANYKFGASDDSHQHLRANNSVIWQAIKWFSRDGFSLLDFGRTSLDNKGLRQFKLGWATTEHQIEYVKYNLKSASFVTSKDESAGWHNRLFRNLPLSLSRAAGSLLYRHIA